MRFHVSSALSFLSVLALAACDPAKPVADGGQTSADSGMVNVDDGGTGNDEARDFCLAWTRAVTEYAARCGAIVDGGVDEAVHNAQRTCDAWPLPRHDFEPSAVMPCLDQYRTATCTALIDLSACIAVAPGSQLEAEPCFASDECVPGLHCDPSATCPGLCRPPVPAGGEAPLSEWCAPSTYLAASGRCEARVAVGESCAATTPTGRRRECVNGAICNFAAVCEAVTRRGAPTEGCGPFDAPCGEGLWCDGTCKPLSDEGQSCDTFTPCRVGLSCMSNVCARPMTMTGALCNAPSDCGPSHFCRINFLGGSLERSCQPRVARGQACEFYGSCEPGLVCQQLQSSSGGICAPPRGAGERCEVDEQCRTNLRCESGSQTCVALGSLGDDCAAGNHCLSGRCAALKCTAASFCVEP